jgi:hypothetical protein
MRALVSVCVVVLVVLVAVGFYRGWFALSGPARDPDGNRINVGLTVDPAKASADAAEARDAVSDAAGQGRTEPE